MSRRKTAAPVVDEMRKYVVQVAIVKDIEVEADDELQAERAAYRAASDRDRDNIVALKVLEMEDNGGALESDSNIDNWAWAKKNMNAMDRDWVCG